MTLSKPNDTSSTAKSLVVMVLLIASVSITYWQTLKHDFVNYDDDQYVYENSAVQGGITRDSIEWALTRRHSNNWHPLTWISHMLDCELSGLKPSGHHLTSVLLHAANAALLFLLIRRITGQVWLSALVAAVFALHPLRVESVAWVSERKDVLSAFFFMLSLLAYLSWARSEKTRWRYLLALVLVSCGLMSKPMLVTLPVIMLLLDYWPLERFSVPPARSTTWNLILEKIPFFALSAASCVATVVAQREAVASFELLPLPLRLGNSFLSVLVYLRQLFVPLDLVPFYPFQPPSMIAIAGSLSALVILVITVWAIRSRKSRPYLLFGWLWYLVMLLPVIGIVQVGEQAHADRYTYLPQIGILLALALITRECLATRGSSTWIKGVAGTTIIVMLAYTTTRQLTHWRNSRSLWEYTLSKTERNDLAHINLGQVMVKEGMISEGLEQFHLALRIRPHLAEAHNNIAAVLMDQGRNAEAMIEFEKAIQSKPYYAEANNNYATLLAAQGQPAEALRYFQKAREARPDYPEVHYNMGNLAASQGRLAEAVTLYHQAIRLRPRYSKAYLGLGAVLVLEHIPEEAIKLFETAIQIDPEFVQAHYNLGLVFEAQKQPEEAIGHFKRATVIEPKFAEAHYRWALVLQGQGKAADALVQFERAIAADPRHSSSHNNLAWILATSPNAALRDGERALEHALKANELTGGDHVGVLDTLAAAYAETGNFDDAALTAQRALTLVSGQGRDRFAIQLRARLALYESKKPYRSLQ